MTINDFCTRAIDSSFLQDLGSQVRGNGLEWSMNAIIFTMMRQAVFEGTQVTRPTIRRRASAIMGSSHL